MGETFDVDGLSVEVLEAERRRITRVRVRRSGRARPTAAEHGRREERLRRARRPAQRRQVDAAQPAGRREARHRLRQAADHPQPHHRRPATPPDGQVVFVDTPGVHRPLHRLNVRMVDAALEALREVDVVAAVVDATEADGRRRSVPDGPGHATSPEPRSCSRSTRSTWWQKRRCCRSSSATAASVGFADIVPVSALTGDNVDRLENVSCSRTCRKGEPLYPDDYLTDQPERFFVAELVREQVLQHTHAELPFASAVVVDRFEEPDDEGGCCGCYCTILVERESQKPIVHRQGRGDDQGDRHRGAARARAVLRRRGVSRSAREGARRLARRRAHAATNSACPKAAAAGHAPPTLMSRCRAKSAC